MSGARYIVIVFDPTDFTGDSRDMHVGPFVSGASAQRLAGRLNESTPLGAQVFGLYPARDATTHATLADWIERAGAT